MIVDCISDLHGYLPHLEGGDLLLIAGDITGRDKEEEWARFESWLCDQPYKEKILVAGNHDNFLASADAFEMWHYWDKLNITYLCDSGTEFEGFKIWGSPWTKTFPCMNPKCKAFTMDTEEELATKFSLIPLDTNILITHSPPYGYFDCVSENFHVGSTILKENLYNLEFSLKLHVFGHIHEGGGRRYSLRNKTYTNVSLVNERYQHVNKSIRVIL